MHNPKQQNTVLLQVDEGCCAEGGDHVVETSSPVRTPEFTLGARSGTSAVAQPGEQDGLSGFRPYATEQSLQVWVMLPHECSPLDASDTCLPEQAAIWAERVTGIIMHMA